MTALTESANRARQSRGISNSAIYAMVADVLRRNDAKGQLLLDVGCGTGSLRPVVEGLCARYLGVDVVRYDALPPDVEFVQFDLETGKAPLPDGTADIVTAVETIEHVENPRALMRELTRLVKPGGVVVVTTPNQQSLLSLMTLVVKGMHSAFQDVHYPAHLSALLAIDLRRIARENNLVDARICFSHEGRIVFTAIHYPAFISRAFPCACSDNVLLFARKPRT